MSVTTAFRSIVIMTLVAAIGHTALPAAIAQDKPAVIRKGEFDGQWHGMRVKFNIQEAHANNTFDGIAEVAEGANAGLKFGIHGRLDKDNALVVMRYVAGDFQVARVGPPQVVDGTLIWRGETSGVGLREGVTWAFELRVPQP